MLIRARNVFIASAALIAMAAVPAEAQSLATAQDSEWVRLSGTVEAVSGEDFILDYGPNSITVEMDDYDWYNENAVLAGDDVTVTGRIDNDFLQSRRLEASSVYVDSIHTLFYASPADEEDFTSAVDNPIVASTGMVVTGTVESIAGDEMVVDAAILDYMVDVGTLNYDPFDDDGLQHVEVGDRVIVSGQFDDSDFFDAPEIDATAITELRA